MAAFHIHQDAEKENPVIPLKEKGLLKPNVLQPITVGLGAAAAALKDKQQGRQGFAVLSSNTNGNAPTRIVGGNKANFREVGNTKGNNENAGFVVSNGDCNDVTTAAANAAVLKKSTVVPVVEQFKSFSVYEDQKDNYQQVVQETSIDKENVIIQHQQQRLPFDIKRDKDASFNEDDHVLDTTPMSVSDAFSPMSVDRTQLSASKTSLQQSDDSNGGKVADPDQKIHIARNDRERFFEVVEYQDAILDYFMESEKKHRPKPYYMRRQADINNSMRTILVDWLVEVSEEYNLDTETLYLSVSYIDRFLSHMSVVRSKLQLVGTAAMYIAAKYEEIYPPDVGEFVFITDDTYNKAQVLRMEQIILKILSFDLCTPTGYVFLNTYAVVFDMPDKLKYLAQYICELSLLDADPYLGFYPSKISSAAMALARLILDYPIWTEELSKVTKYNLTDIKEVFLHLSVTHNAAATLPQTAIQEKYKSDKFKNVATIAPVTVTDESFDEIVKKYNESLMNEASLTKSASMTATSNENVRRMISLMFN